ncbi:MAG: efflux RND transporter periplasmic adaptor subunit [Planctomycetes bacterium]|nr:efflux RND transporter periplasmic adaptor subunit [Planctomycetota bacterium]
MTPPSAQHSLRFRILGTILLLVVAVAAAGSFWLLKQNKKAQSQAAAQGHGEMAEAIEGADARTRMFARSTTAIGTVRALQSIDLKNELAGTVRKVQLETGRVVEAGAILVELDVAVEQAELAAYEADARLAASMLARMEQALKDQGASAADVDRARAEHDRTMANVARTKAVIEQKVVRAPFRSRVGMVDLHPGQYLVPGTTITTLQGVDDAVHVDFSVTQETATRLEIGQQVEVTADERTAGAKIVAMDARVEATTRNTMVRALLSGLQPLPTPGASVRVRVPVEAPHEVVVVPVSALRRGPGGDYVFAIAKAQDGKLRAKTRRVHSGASLGDEIIVIEGVKAGERVAALGSFKLREDVLVDDKTLVTKQ